MIEVPTSSVTYPWESFSRGRATSCARHGYAFTERGETMPLLGLTHHDKRMRERLAPAHGILVVRSLEPKGAEIRVTDLFALPKGTGVPEGLGV